MELQPRKIGYYQISIDSGEEEYDVDILLEVFSWIIGKDKTQRRLVLQKENRVHFLAKYDKYQGRYFIIYESIRHNYSPNLINKDTAEERPSPKKLEEGDKVRTHVVLWKENDSLHLMIETRMGGIGVGNICRMLRGFCRMYNIANTGKKRVPYRIFYNPILRDNFIEELAKMGRVTKGELYVSKKILGSDLLNFSDRTEVIKKEVSIVLRPVQGASLFERLKYIYNTCIGTKFEVTDNEEPKFKIIKMRATGKYPEGLEKTFDSDEFKQTDVIYVESKPETGEVVTESIKTEMMKKV